MVDYCADDISSQEAKILIEYIQEKLGSEIFHFYPGVSYRHCLVWKMGGPILVLLLLPMTLPAAKLLNISQTGLMSQSFINSWCKAITF